MSESDPPTRNEEGRFDLLVQKYLTKSLEPAEADELRELLENEPGLAERLFGQFEVDALLRDAATADRVSPLHLEAWSRSARQAGRSGSGYGWAAAAAVVAIAGVILYPRQPASGPVVSTAQPTTTVEQEANTGAVAVVGDLVGAVPEAGGPTFIRNAPIDPGVIKLKSGILRLDFFSGARVLLTGPAEFELVSKDRANFRSGKLSAEVPPQARGFTIVTPEGEVRDLGTAFGMNVGEGGSDIHVIEGEVEIPGIEPKLLRKGEAVKLEKGGTSRRVPADPTAFQLTGDVQRLSTDELRRRNVIWERAMNKMNADPSLLARFSLGRNSDSNSFRYPNASLRKEIADGAIIGCLETDGRWPGLSALQFGTLSDRVRIDVPGEFEALTFTAWVSVQALPQRYSSLLMTEGFETGEVHWQIVDNGRVRIGISHPGTDIPMNFDSRRMVHPDTFGQWLHLAAVVDRKSRTITHYFNGSQTSQERYPDMPVLRMGTSNIGNWSDLSNRIPIRNFVGMMDELTIHDRALSAREIDRLHDSGCPAVRSATR
jgi:hypothetical protein